MFSVLVIRLRSLRLLRVSGIVMRLRMFLLLITFLKASHSFRNRLLVISRRNIRRRITIPLTLSNLKLLRRITRTENIDRKSVVKEKRRNHRGMHNRKNEAEDK